MSKQFTVTVKPTAEQTKLRDLASRLSGSLNAIMTLSRDAAKEAGEAKKLRDKSLVLTSARWVGERAVSLMAELRVIQGETVKGDVAQVQKLVGQAIRQGGDKLGVPRPWAVASHTGPLTVPIRAEDGSINPTLFDSADTALMAGVSITAIAKLVMRPSVKTLVAVVKSYMKRGVAFESESGPRTFQPSKDAADALRLSLAGLDRGKSLVPADDYPMVEAVLRKAIANTASESTVAITDPPSAMDAERLHRAMETVGAGADNGA